MKRFWKFFIGFLVIIIVVGGGYFLWDRYFSPQAKYLRKITEGQKQYQQVVEEYKKELKADTYGGKTPEETLKMFVAALRKGDVDLASKYFFIDASGDRSKWVNYLNDIKERGYMTKMANDLEKYNEAEPTFGPYYIFVYLNDDKTIGLQINMILNQEAQIWKIESM